LSRKEILAEIRKLDDRVSELDFRLKRLEKKVL
jgi:hypothetical protein